MTSGDGAIARVRRTSIPCRDPASSPAAGIHPLAVVPLLEKVEALPTNSTGALVVGDEADPRGVILVEHGRICWAAPTRMGRRLTEILRHQVSPPLEPELLHRVYARCREKMLPLGETLVEEGIISADELRRALRQHAAEALAVLSQGAAAEVRFVAHSRRKYDARFSFGPAELLVGVGALRDPVVTVQARSVLRRTLASGGSGVAYLGDPRDMLWPIGEVDADRLGVSGVVELAEWASQAFDVVRAVRGNPGFVSFRTRSDMAALVWAEGDVTYAAVLGDPSALACALVDRMRSRRGPG
jgi:hypothetical protein